MEISVVIPAHNRPAFLQEALGSVKSQTHSDWQLVIVEDGSQPPVDAESLDVSVGTNCILVRNKVALGVARAKNAGLRAATGEVVTPLEDDDRLAPIALEAMCSAFRDHPQLDCVFLGVEPFAPYATGVAESQQRAIARIVSIAVRAEDGRYSSKNGCSRPSCRRCPSTSRGSLTQRCRDIAGGFHEAGPLNRPGRSVRALYAASR